MRDLLVIALVLATMLGAIEALENRERVSMVGSVYVFSIKGLGDRE
jgi:hypothetical protein